MSITAHSFLEHGLGLGSKCLALPSMFLSHKHVQKSTEYNKLKNKGMAGSFLPSNPVFDIKLQILPHFTLI